VEHINKELEKVLSSLVKKQLDNILEQIPVDELIVETRTAKSYR
jgi:hypothetical protein